MTRTRHPFIPALRNVGPFVRHDSPFVRLKDGFLQVCNQYTMVQVEVDLDGRIDFEYFEPPYKLGATSSVTDGRLILAYPGDLVYSVPDIKDPEFPSAFDVLLAKARENITGPVVEVAYGPDKMIQVLSLMHNLGVDVFRFFQEEGSPHSPVRFRGDGVEGLVMPMRTSREDNLQ